ncbi:MAG: septum formation initiator family protein [Thermodesulfobacteriota bacterium]|nr:septum formation initiator family protein [Thermodesulfobacteriota bacterium]|tara:strand:+ start:63208 stop:63477 length:270 start_codon:yes stop_codon:yes gene_type:complete
MNFKYFKLSIIFISSFLLLIVAIEVVELIQQTRKRNHIYSEIDRIKAENNIFKKEISLLEKNEFYLNLLARKKLGMIKEGEKIYRFDND